MPFFPSRDGSKSLYCERRNVRARADVAKCLSISSALSGHKLLAAPQLPIVAARDRANEHIRAAACAISDLSAFQEEGEFECLALS
jgi:hypothetical protein